MRSSIVADEMEVLASSGGDTERLLHETVRFISVAILAVVGIPSVIVAPARAFRRLPGSSHCILCDIPASTLALHFAVS